MLSKLDYFVVSTTVLLRLVSIDDCCTARRNKKINLGHFSCPRVPCIPHEKAVSGSLELDQNTPQELVEGHLIPVSYTHLTLPTIYSV